jgi:uncharacterized protein (TIRG00374 family)
MRLSKIITAVFFLAGLILLGTMVWQVGPLGVLESLRLLGPWLAPFLLLEGISHLLHAMGWAACFPGPKAPLHWWQIFLVRLAGSAINQITPTAMVGGEVVRVLLLEHTLPRAQAVAPVVIGKATVTMAQMLYLAIGTLYVIHQLPLPQELQWILGLTIGLVSLGLMSFVALQRYGMLSKVGSKLSTFKRTPEKLRRFSQHLDALDKELLTYYTTFRLRFVRSIILHFIAFAFDGVKTYVLLQLLLKNDAPSLTKAWMIAVAVSALDQMFFFVPGRLGTLEGVRFSVLSALGIAQIYGLIFGLIARLEQLVWSGLGLLAYAVCTRFPQILRHGPLTTRRAPPPLSPASYPSPPRSV